MIKTVAIIGRPNVGKSSIFNCLIKQRKAVVSDLAGTTRDIKREVCVLDDDIEILLGDTGGIEQGELQSTLFEEVRNHALNEAKKADLLLFVVDGKKPLLDEDRRLFRELQRYKSLMFLVVNKIDNDKEKENIWEFSSLGIQAIYPVSATHNRGFVKLKDAIKAALFLKPSINHKKPCVAESEVESVKIAIIGRVNVGKSSLLNALLGENRSVVSDIAGTTIDPVDDICYHKDHCFTFIDTAGLRRKGKIEGIEKYALLRTKEMLEASDIALLVLDSSAPLVELDEKIGSLALEHYLGVIIVLNKWDIRYQDIERTKKEIRERFKYLSYAPIVTISAQSGRKIHQLKDKIIDVFHNFKRRISTSLLNEVITSAYRQHPIPSDRGKLVKIYYATQYKSEPPRISLVMNRPKALHFSYKRFLVNALRKHFDFEGVPILIETKKKGQRDAEVVVE